MKKLIDKYYNLSNIAKASFWFLICSFLQKGISVIVTPIFTRILTTYEYGQFSVFSSWQLILNIFISFCLSAGVYQQGLVKYEDDMKKFSSSMQGLTFTLIIMWTCIYLIFHSIINKLIGFKTIYILLMIFIIWSNNVFAFWSNEQKVQFKYKKLILITLITSLLNPILGIIFIKYMDNNVMARILGIVIIGIIFYLPLFVIQLKKGGRFYDKKYWKYALSYNLPLIPHYLSQIILSNSDRIMIKNMVSSETAGIYSLAYSIALIMTLFNESLMQTITPWMYKKIKNGEIKKITKISFYSLILIAVVNLTLIVLAPEAVYIFAPSEYYDAVKIIPPVAMSVFFMFAYDLFAKFEFYYEKTKLISTATLIGAIINIILNCIFINKFGYIAAAYTTLFCYILYAVFHYLAMRKICREKLNDINPFNLKFLLCLSIGFIILGFSFMLLYQYVFIRYIAVCIIFTVLLIKRKTIIKLFKEIK